MKAERRRRNDPRREATRTALIEAAESLFAEAGFDETGIDAMIASGAAVQA